MSSFSFSSASHSLAPYFFTKSIFSLASWSLICFLRFHSSQALLRAFCFLSSDSRWARWRSRALCCATSSPSCCMPSIDLLSCFDPSRAESRLPARVFAPSVIPNGSAIGHQLFLRLSSLSSMRWTALRTSSQRPEKSSLCM